MPNFIANAPAHNAPKVQTPTNDTSLIFSKMNRHKLAVFSVCDKEGGVVEGGSVVTALLIDADKSIESQWQTAFENSNPELKLPSLSAGIQSGQILESMGAMGGIVGQVAGTMSNLSSPIASSLGLSLSDLEGRTNLTKVNTEQIFLSTSSVRISLTIFFMAIKSAKEEVEKQIMTLESWAVPAYLHNQTALVSVTNEGLKGLFPSEIPPFVSFSAYGKTYAPFVIESINAPIVRPSDEDGNRLDVTVTMTILSRAAWDKSGIKKLYGF